ncbi:Ubiquitin-fold modifier-conjugating enzyme [Parasponia andersonii]|uniref:E2 ubiquitin-conjugating enzyme n=1 Tax=Parasponia andersonii TaxID=3476 RepID=A0A2P5CPX6_PARAD|nr:Ubiquitin-fold modifier-conjugating enzyme [Parasponia andersonii]
MADKSCVKRLQKEYRALCKEPVSHVVARPSPNDILEWHYVLEGSEGTPFAGGYYYGKIKFPPEYPYKPPGITMVTPNGRFMTQRKLCLSMSDFHPESWNPMWSVSSILQGLLSFMMDTSPTTGSVNTTTAEKQHLAKDSLAFNCKHSTFRKMFPEYVEKFNQQQQLITQQVSADTSELENSKPLLEDVDSNGDVKREMVPNNRNKDRKQHSFSAILVGDIGFSNLQATMRMKSPVYPKNETNDYNGDEYDPHAEFSQFLEEAKRNENFEFEIPCANPEVAGNRKQDHVKKKKKAWKVFLLPWLKGEKNSKSHMEPATNSRVPNTKRGFASGPIYSCGQALDGKHRRPTSGPIASLFNPSRRADTELPYMCLSQLGSPPTAQSYGPVYNVP